MPSKKRIVITGASRGLGRALASVFAEQGHAVCGCARSPDAIQELRRQFLSPHRFDVIDVTQRQQVDHWANAVIDEFGAPDLLLNNAAVINPNAPLWETSPEHFADVINVNITGVFHLVRAFVPAMILRGSGVIVNFSSGWGRSTSPEVAPYCASKWAIEGMTRSLADELPAGLAAIPLNPGIINTDMLQSCFGDDAHAYPSPSAWAKKVAPFLLRLGPEDNGKPLTAPSP